MDPKWLEGTVSITSLRPPVDRILSSYIFEGRWKQMTHNRTTAAALPLQSWMDRVLDEQSHLESGVIKGPVHGKPKWMHEAHMKPNWMHVCVSNCYCAWFGGLPSAPCDDKRWSQALATLRNFSFVVDATKFTSSLEEVNEALGVAVDVEHANAVGGWRSGHEAFNLTAADVARLVQLNAKDDLLIETFFNQSILTYNQRLERALRRSAQQLERLNAAPFQRFLRRSD